MVWPLIVGGSMGLQAKDASRTMASWVVGKAGLTCAVWAEREAPHISMAAKRTTRLRRKKAEDCACFDDMARLLGWEDGFPGVDMISQHIGCWQVPARWRLGG